MPVRLVLFDLDGTVYVSGKLLDGITDLLKKLKKSGIEYGFMTNNSSVNPSDYLLKLNKLGLETHRQNLITSCEATCLMLSELELGPELYIVGTSRFVTYLNEQGFRHCEDNPSAVLVGFDLELTFEKLTKATRLVSRGVRLVASHPDVACPSAQGPIPDAGMVLAAIKAGTGKDPEAIAGKPNKWIVEVAVRHFGVDPAEIVIVGDRLATDIRMGHEFNMRSVLVLSGISKREDLELFSYRPDVVVGSVADLVEKQWFGKLGWL